MMVAKLATALALEADTPPVMDEQDEQLMPFLVQAARVLCLLGRTPDEDELLNPFLRAAWIAAAEKLEVQRAQRVGIASTPGGAALLEEPWDDGKAWAEVRATTIAERLAEAAYANMRGPNG